MNSNTPSNRRISKWQPYILFGFVALALIAAIGSFSIFQFGNVQGLEFSPETFKRRSFSYYEIPLLRWQISPIRREKVTGDLENYLLNNGLVKTTATVTPLWDLVLLKRGQFESHTTDAHLLCMFFDIEQKSEKNFWLEWSKDHQQSAAILWPQVVRLARRKTYLLIPHLFALATRIDDAEELNLVINQKVAKQYYDLGVAQQQISNHRAAIRLLSEAIHYAPNDRTILETRIISNEKLGNDAEVLADEAQIRKFKHRDVKIHR